MECCNCHHSSQCLDLFVLLCLLRGRSLHMVVDFSNWKIQVIDDAEAQYLAFFASKTVEMIRAPDSYVYPAPFNLIETFFIAPFE